MTNKKRTVELIANDSNEAKELKNSLEAKGLSVNHIYGGSSKPILIENENYFFGAGNIRFQYLSKN